MKDFMKYVLATVVGLIVFGIVIALLGAMSMVGMVASGEQARNVSDNSVLVVNLTGAIDEQSSNDGLFSMASFSGNDGNLGMQQLLGAISKAKDNDHIKGIYLEAGALSADYAQLQELRAALDDFKKSGKWIVAYGDVYSQGAYYLCSVADKVWLNPKGEVDWHGLASQPIFVKDLLKKVGIEMQVIKVGRYKSATEMFTEDHMSDANREQTEAYITSIWRNIVGAVAKSRKISADSLNVLADKLVIFEGADAILKYGLVDSLLYQDAVKTEVKRMLGLEEKKRVNQVSVAEMQSVKQRRNGEEVAVYYAWGDIVDESGFSLLSGGDHQIVAKDVNKDLQALMDNDDVKAVVLRINSPGGSAYASEQLWHQIQQLKAKKPVVVSMGGYAASGGYYMSCGADYIFAEPTTLTGSIGIFGTIPDRSKLMTEKLGLKFDEVKTNRNAAFGTSARPFNAEELGYLQAYIERGYKLFRQRVADGRKMTTDQVEAIAQGHVFTGEDALKIKLVDELGGLDKAVEKAAKLAKLDEYYTSGYPAAPSMLDELLNKTTGSGGNYLDEKMRQMLGNYYEPVMLLRLADKWPTAQARMEYFVNIK